jgi:hypothetical protein
VPQELGYHIRSTALNWTELNWTEPNWTELNRTTRSPRQQWREMATFQLFFSWVWLRTYQHPCNNLSFLIGKFEGDCVRWPRRFEFILNSILCTVRLYYLSVFHVRTVSFVTITQRPSDIWMRHLYETLVKLYEQGRSEVLVGKRRTCPSANPSTTNPTRKAVELSSERSAFNIQHYGTTLRKTIIKVHTIDTSFSKSNSLVNNEFQKPREQQPA